MAAVAAVAAAAAVVVDFGAGGTAGACGCLGELRPRPEQTRSPQSLALAHLDPLARLWRKSSAGYVWYSHEYGKGNDELFGSHFKVEITVRPDVGYARFALGFKRRFK